jgi:hypothetical protein
MRISVHVQYDTKTIQLQVGQHKEVELNTESITLNVELWPRSKINQWPSYGVMTVSNIIRICRFRKFVANCDKWPT